MNESPQEFNGGVPGGNYSAEQAPNGTWTIKALPIFSEVEGGKRGNEKHIGPEWMNAAIAKSKELKEVQQHMAPVHLGHHGALKNKETPRVGFLSPQHIGRLLIEGKPQWVLFADVVGISEENFSSLKNLSHPYRSVEIGDWNKPEIASLALLSDESPYFKFPMLTIGQMKAHAGKNPIKFSNERDGNHHFFEFDDSQGDGPQWTTYEKGPYRTQPVQNSDDEHKFKLEKAPRHPNYEKSNIPPEKSERAGSEVYRRLRNASKASHDLDIGFVNEEVHRGGNVPTSVTPEGFVRVLAHPPKTGGHRRYPAFDKMGKLGPKAQYKAISSLRRHQKRVGEGMWEGKMAGPRRLTGWPNWIPPKNLSHEFSSPPGEGRRAGRRGGLKKANRGSYIYQQNRFLPLHAVQPFPMEGDNEDQSMRPNEVPKKGWVRRNRPRYEGKIEPTYRGAQGVEGVRRAYNAQLAKDNKLSPRAKYRYHQSRSRMEAAQKRGEFYPGSPMPGTGGGKMARDVAGWTPPKHIHHEFGVGMGSSQKRPRGAFNKKYPPLQNIPTWPKTNESRKKQNLAHADAQRAMGLPVEGTSRSAMKNIVAEGIESNEARDQRQADQKGYHWLDQPKPHSYSEFADEGGYQKHRRRKYLERKFSRKPKRGNLTANPSVKHEEREFGWNKPKPEQNLLVGIGGTGGRVTHKAGGTYVHSPHDPRFNKQYKKNRGHWNPYDLGTIHSRSHPHDPDNPVLPGKGGVQRAARLEDLGMLSQPDRPSKKVDHIPNVTTSLLGPKTRHKLWSSTKRLNERNEKAKREGKSLTPWHPPGPPRSSHNPSHRVMTIPSGRDDIMPPEDIAGEEWKKGHPEYNTPYFLPESHPTMGKGVDPWNRSYRHNEFSGPVPVWLREFSGMPIWAGECPHLFNMQPTDFAIRNSQEVNYMKSLARANKTSKLSPAGRIDGQGFHDFADNRRKPRRGYEEDITAPSSDAHVYHPEKGRNKTRRQSYYTTSIASEDVPVHESAMSKKDLGGGFNKEYVDRHYRGKFVVHSNPTTKHIDHLAKEARKNRAKHYSGGTRADVKRYVNTTRYHPSLKGIYTRDKDDNIHHHVWDSGSAHHHPVMSIFEAMGHSHITGADRYYGHSVRPRRRPGSGKLNNADKHSQQAYERHEKGQHLSWSEFHEFTAPKPSGWNPDPQWNPGPQTKTRMNPAHGKMSLGKKNYEAPIWHPGLNEDVEYLAAPGRGQKRQLGKTKVEDPTGISVRGQVGNVGGGTKTGGKHGGFKINEGARRDHNHAVAEEHHRVWNHFRTNESSKGRFGPHGATWKQLHDHMPGIMAMYNESRDKPADYQLEHAQKSVRVSSHFHRHKIRQELNPTMTTRPKHWGGNFSETIKIMERKYKDAHKKHIAADRKKRHMKVESGSHTANQAAAEKEIRRLGKKKSKALKSLWFAKETEIKNPRKIKIRNRTLSSDRRIKAHGHNFTHLHPTNMANKESGKYLGRRRETRSWGGGYNEFGLGGLALATLAGRQRGPSWYNRDWGRHNLVHGVTPKRMPDPEKHEASELRPEHIPKKAWEELKKGGHKPEISRHVAPPSATSRHSKWANHPLHGGALGVVGGALHHIYKGGKALERWEAKGVTKGGKHEVTRGRVLRREDRIRKLADSKGLHKDDPRIAGAIDKMTKKEYKKADIDPNEKPMWKLWREFNAGSFALQQGQAKRLLSAKKNAGILRLNKNGQMSNKLNMKTPNSALRIRQNRGIARPVSRFADKTKAKWDIQPPGVGWY